MAQVLDNVGRQIDTAAMTLKEIKGLVQSMMKGQTGPAKAYTPTGGGNDKTKELAASLDAAAKASAANKAAIDKMTTAFGNSIKSMQTAAKQYVDAIKNYTEEVNNARASMGGATKGGGSVAEPTSALKAAFNEKGGIEDTKSLKSLDKRGKKEEKVFKNLDNMARHGLKKGSLYVNDVRLRATMQNIYSLLGRYLKTASNASRGGGGSGGGRGGGGAAGAAGAGGGPEEVQVRARVDADDVWALQNALFQVYSWVNKAEKAFFGFNTVGTMLGGIVEKEREFLQDIRKTAYETAGVTKELQGVQRAYEDIGKTVKRTGQDRGQTQKAYIDALKKGVRDQDKALDISVAQLNTATMIGLKAEDLGETFVDWHHQFRMNVGQLNEMNRGMRDVARYTGITGKNLAEAMKTSQEFVKQLRNAATLTANAAKNVMEITAQAQKLGIAEQMNPLMKAMASSTSFIVDASAETRSLLVYAASQTGRIGDLMNGTVLQSKEGIKDMAKGLQGVLKRFGVDSLDEIDQLSNEAKRNINLQLKASFGLELGELRSTIEAMNEAGKTTSDRLADIQKKRKQENLTIEETKGLLEEERRLKTSAALGVMTALDESAKGAKNMEEALAKFGSRRADFEGDLNALGHSWTSNADAARAAIQDAISNVNAGLKDVGKSEMSIDSSRIEEALKDPVAFRELSADISKAEQEFAIAQKAAIDPMSKMEQHLREINDTLRNISSGILSSLMNIAGILLPLAVLIPTFLGQLLTAGMGAWHTMQNIGKSFQFLQGRLQKSTQGQEPASSTVTSTTRGPSASPADIASVEDDALLAAAQDEMKVFTDMRSILREMVKHLAAIRGCVCNAEMAAAKGAAAEAPSAKPATTTTTSPTPAAGTATAGGNLSSPAPAGIGDQMLAKAKEAQKEGAKLIKAAAIMGTIAIAVVTLAAVLTMVTSKILKATKVDIGTAMQTAMNIAGIIGAAAAIAVGVVGAVKGLEELNKFVDETKGLVKTLAKGALALFLLTPAVLGIALGVILMAQGLSSMTGVSWDSALATAGTVAAILVAAGAIAAGVISVIKPIEELNEFINELKPKEIAKTLFKGGLALLILAPALTALAAGVVFLTGGIMSLLGMDAGTAAKVAAGVGALLLSAAVIAGAIIGMIAGLYGLGLLAESLKGPQIALMWSGGYAFLLLAPALTLLAAGVVALIGGIMGVLGIDAATAARTAMDVATLILSAAVIAGAIIGAIAGLWGLGILAGMAWSIILPILGGTAALLILTPAIIGLASAVIFMSQGVMSSMQLDPAVAAETAKAVATIIGSAAAIALGVAAAIGGLYLLGLAVPLIWTGLWAILAGTVALFALTPAVLGLSYAVLNMASQLMSGGVDPSAAAATAQALADVLGAAADIAFSVMAQVAILGVLGALSLVAWVLVPLMFLGIAALNALTPPIVGFALATIAMAKAISGTMSPATAKEAVDGLKSVLDAAGDISSMILSMAGTIMSFSVFALPLFGAMLIGGLMLGTVGLQALKLPIIAYIDAITDIAKAIGGRLDPSQAAEMAEGVANVLAAAGKVADELEAAVPRIQSMGWYVGGWWNPMTIGLWLGIIGLEALKLPMVAYVDAITDIAKAIGGSLNPSQAAEMAEGVANVLASAGAVADELKAAVPRIMGLGWFALGFIGRFIIGMLHLGVQGLEALKNPIVNYVGAIHDISKAIGTKINPAQAAEMAQGVADVLEASANVAEQIQNAGSRLFWIGLMAAYFGTNTKYIWKGIGALKLLEDPIVSFVTQTVALASRLGQVINPAFATEITEGITAITDMAVAVTNLVEKTASRVAILGLLGFYTGWITSSMDSGIQAFKKMKKPVIDFLEATKTAALDMAAVINPSEAKSVMVSLERISLIVKQVGSVFDVMHKSIVPMTQGGFFTKSPLEQVRRAKGELEAFFPVLVEFVNEGIVDSVNSGMKDIDKLRSAAKNLQIMALILDAVGPSMDIMSNSIAPLAQGGFFTKSPIQKIRSAIPEFANMFEQTAEFVQTGIVKPIQAHLSDTKGLKAAGRTIQIMALVLDATRTSIDALANVAAIYSDGGFFTNTTAENISAGLQDDKLPKMIGDIADFTKNGIIKPVERNFTNPKELEKTGKTIKILACVMCATKTMLTKMVDVVALMEPESFWKDAPLEQIMSSKDDFKEYFHAIAVFMKTGILEPVDKVFPDPSEIRKAGTTITILTGVATSLPPLIRGLADATGLAIKGDSFFSSAPMKSIVDAKDQFAEYFKAIAEFMRDGIVEPTLTVFTDAKRVSEARTIIEALTAISAAIPPLIRNLSEAMGLLLDESLFEAAPMKEIHKWKLVWAWYWTSILDFIRDGIVIPIIEELEKKLGVKKIVEAARILRAVASIVSQVPPIIKDLAFKLMPLLEGEGLDEAPMELIQARTGDFTRQFTAIAAFIRDGIVTPILTEIPEAKTITEAARILRAVASILSQLPEIFRNLGKVFGPLDPDDCFAESPLEKIVSNIPTYKAQMTAFATFMREGIITPIFTHFPQPEEITQVAGLLDNMIAVLKLLPTFLAELSAIMGSLTFTMWGLVKSPAAKAHGAVATFAHYFSGIASMLGDGIIRPIRETFATTDELPELVSRMDGVKEIIRKAAEMLDVLGEELAPWVEPTKSFLFFSWGSKMADTGNMAERFRNQFTGIAKAITEGILDPIKQFFPPLAEVEATLATIEGIVGIFKGLDELLIVMAEVLNGMDTSGLDFSKLNKINWQAIGAGLSGTQVGASGGIPMGGGGEGNSVSQRVINQSIQKKEANASHSLASQMSEFIVHATKPGSIYTHDIHIEKLLNDLVTGKTQTRVKRSVASGVGMLTPANMAEAIEREHGAGAEGKQIPAANMAGDAGILGMAKRWMGIGGSSTSAQAAHEKAVSMMEVSELAGRSGVILDERVSASGFNPSGLEANWAEPRKAEVQPSSPIDVHTSVHRDAVGTEAGVATVSSPELSRVASATDAQISLQTQMVHHLSRISEYLKPSTKGESSTNAGGSTATNYVTHRPAKFFKWTTGQHHQLGCKDIGNISNPAS